MSILSFAKKERVTVYIDGSNFYKYLKDEEIQFPRGAKFNYSKFIDFLVGNRECLSKRYYVGIARNFDHTQKSQQIVQSQQIFLSHLQNEGIEVKRGRIKLWHKN